MKLSYKSYFFLSSCIAFTILIGCSSNKEKDAAPQIINAPQVKFIQIADISNNGNGTDLEISFDKVDDESLVSEYQVLVVKASNQESFTLENAENLDFGKVVIQADGINKKFNLIDSSTDTDGDLIVESIAYVVFVLTIADGVNATGNNTLSNPSNSITLSQLFYEIYVSDAGNFNSGPWQILKFDANGQNPSVFIKSNLNWPQDILFLESNNTVLISNFGTNQIKKFNASTGEYIGTFASGINAPTRMKIGPDNILYVLQWAGNFKVLRYNLDGTFVDEFTSVGVNASIGLDWDADNNLYVSSYYDDLVRKFDPEGNDLGLFINSNLAGPTNIWFDDNGDLLVLDYDGTAVKRFDASGNYKGDFLKGLSKCEGVAKLPDGNILIGNGATKSVKMFDPNGNYIKNFISSGAGNLLTPNAVVLKNIE